MPGLGLEEMEVAGVTCPMGAGNLVSIGEDQRRTTYSRVLDESTQAQFRKDWRMCSSDPVVQY